MLIKKIISITLIVIDKLNNNGVILADNVLWSGKVNEKQQD